MTEFRTPAGALANAGRRGLAGLLMALCLAGPAAVHAAGPFDAEGRPIPAMPAAKRVVAVGGSITEIVYALGAQDRLVAVDTTSQYPPAALERLPNVGYLRALSAEGVLSMRPDLILAEADAGPPGAMKQMKTAGARIVVLRKVLDAEGVAYKIRAVARSLGLDAKGAALADRYTRDMARLRAAIEKAKTRPRVLFVLSIGRGSPLAGGRETSADAIIRLAGGVNAIDGYTGYKPLSPEAAIAAAPDIVLVTTRTRDMMGGATNLLARPELKLTPAGRRRRLIAMDGLFLLGFGPRTPRAVRELAAKLHPRLALPRVGDAGEPAPR